MLGVLKCGCTPDASGFGYCDECEQALRKKVYRNMSQERKNYDRYVLRMKGPCFEEEPSFLDKGCCSCHIDPPCSFCENSNEEEIS